jgi:hypothetical protein
MKTPALNLDRQDQRGKGVFLYFHFFLIGNEFVGPQKKEKFAK